jgi:hypothetical protein
MLDHLTPEQEALLPSFVEYGLRVGLSTDRTDRPAAEEAIRAHYTACGLAPPEVRWFDSPWATVGEMVRARVWGTVGEMVRARVWGTVGARVGEMVWEMVGARVGEMVRARVWGTVGASVGEMVREMVGARVGEMVGARVWGTVWASVGALIDADDAAWILAWDAYGVSLPPAALTFRAMIEHVCWLYPGKNVVLASERPLWIKRDPEGRLHGETGKAIEWPDGNGVSAWHGQSIPHEWVSGKPPSPSEALHWPDMDQRAAACEIVGWHNILDRLSARTIEDSGDPMWGRLIEVSLPDSGRERFLDALCGTGRRFALPVPPDTHSVDAAQSALHGGLPASILRHSVERT